MPPRHERNNRKPYRNDRNNNQFGTEQGGSRGILAAVREQHSKNEKRVASTNNKKPATPPPSSVVHPSVLDINSDYFQKEYNPKNLPLEKITELKLNGRGFVDIKNLSLCPNLKRLEVVKNKLSNLQVCVDDDNRL